MSAKTWTIDELKSRIGTSLATREAEVERTAIRTYARAVGFTDPVFNDVDHARSLGHPDLPMPQGMTPMQKFVPGGTGVTLSMAHGPGGMFFAAGTLILSTERRA